MVQQDQRSAHPFGDELYNFLRFLRAAMRPATRPATPSASMTMLDGSGTVIPPDDEPLDDEPVDVELLELLLVDVLVVPP